MGSRGGSHRRKPFAMEGEHYAVVHHDYRIPHDMPQPGSAT
jgi:hypothetical protein